MVLPVRRVYRLRSKCRVENGFMDSGTATAAIAVCGGQGAAFPFYFSVIDPLYTVVVVSAWER